MAKFDLETRIEDVTYEMEILREELAEQEALASDPLSVLFDRDWETLEDVERIAEQASQEASELEEQLEDLQAELEDLRSQLQTAA